MEIVHAGWLIKSPPEKRIWRAKWRRRWFVLRHSGQIPGQYLLEYYTDPNCKKLKGKIDLDQCEQVDADLTFQGRKWNYQFMFDIRTPKRIYYLVAETELDMNKWVDCICSVCGLKIHVEEDFGPTADTISLPVTSQPFPSPIQEAEAREESVPGSPAAQSDAGQYIPISECISGTMPVSNGYPLSGQDSLLVAPPPPPKSVFDRTISGEFYDYPRQILPPSLNDHRTSPDPTTDELYKIPPVHITSESNGSRNRANLPPTVNWETYPKDQEDCSPVVPNPNHQNGISELSSNLADLSINKSKYSQKPHDIYENISVRTISGKDKENLDDNVFLSAPPRPPKAPHLNEILHMQNIHVSLETTVVPTQIPTTGNANAYDVPPSAQMSLVQTRELGNQPDLSPSSKVPLPVQTGLDEMYDFPKPLQGDSLNAMPPAPSTSSIQSKKHAYSNAPTGYMNDNVFTYDLKPTAAFGENYLNMDSQRPKAAEVYTDMSGEIHSPVAVYSNLPSPLLKGIPVSDTPPAVNRYLKPKRKASDDFIVHSRSCSSASSTDASAKSPSPVDGLIPPVVNRKLKPKHQLNINTDGTNKNLLTLAPPPVGRIGSANSKRSFRKPSRATPSPTSPSQRYESPTSVYSARCRMRHSDHSSSEDDHSSSGGSRRNSSNDDQAKSFLNVRREPEIQYLDLDLDCDHGNAQSPKSPEKMTSSSTVYKTVDFVKTEAFNRMRQNVEETYRKSQ